MHPGNHTGGWSYRVSDLSCAPAHPIRPAADCAGVVGRPGGTVPAFLSGEWIERARERVLRERRRLKAIVGDQDLSVLLLVDDRPGLEGEAIYIQFVAGRLDVVAWGHPDVMEQTHPRQDFRVTAAYETYARIHQGRLREAAALLSGKARVRGDFSKALAMIRAVVELNKFLRQVPAHYDGLPLAQARAQGDRRERP